MKSKGMKIFLIIALVIGLGFGAYDLYLWQYDNVRTKKVVKEINNKVSETTDDVVIQADKLVVATFLKVDYSKLKSTNNEVVGWIRVNNTKIDYPLVQTDNNDYYLSHSFDKSKNEAGWVFVDYRNNLDVLDANTIIYAHNRKDGSMFGTLKEVFASTWLKNKDNHFINLNIGNKDYIFKVISVYEIKTENYYLTRNFETTDDYQKFINISLTRSRYNFDTKVTTENKLLTLSTCSSDSNKRIVLQAKLIYEN